MSLLVFGTVAIDNVRTPAGERQNILGGSASHFAMSARFFTDVHIVAVIGRDFPQDQLAVLKKKNINLLSLKQSAGETFRWTGEYRKDDLNTALTLQTQLGVIQNYVPEIHPSQAGARNVFLANYDPDAQAQLLPLLKKPRQLGLDSMNLWIDIKRPSLLALMQEVDLFVANDGEARALTGERNLIAAAKHLRKLGPRLIVVKKGEHGVLFYSDEFMFSFPAFPVEKVVDPTGAGDTFAGGLMGYLARSPRLNKGTLKEAVIHATTLASFNVEGFGLERTSRLTMADVNRRKKQLLAFISV